MAVPCARTRARRFHESFSRPLRTEAAIVRTSLTVVPELATAPCRDGGGSGGPPTVTFGDAAIAYHPPLITMQSLPELR